MAHAVKTPPFGMLGRELESPQLLNELFCDLGRIQKTLERACPRWEDFG